MDISPIAHIRTDFASKFGLPRQSGLVDELRGVIEFEREYAQPEAVRGLDGFSHIWLIWGFSQSVRAGWSATVRPPRLGGNVRMGVFATRSPFRPNGLGLSCVKLEAVELDARRGPLLRVAGIDMLDGTPIYDIKPYVPLADCRPDAREGFTEQTRTHALKVDFPPELMELIPEDRRAALMGVLAQDPRPGYADDPERRYGVEFAGYDVRFCVVGDALKVVEVEPPGGAGRLD